MKINLIIYAPLSHVKCANFLFAIRRVNNNKTRHYSINYANNG